MKSFATRSLLALASLLAATPSQVCAAFIDNVDGTITDTTTGLMWEKKDGMNDSKDYSNPHDTDNTYSWGIDPQYSNNRDGTAYTSFLPSLNNRCDADALTPCTSDSECSAVGGTCGLAGFRDWRLPTISELASLVADPCTSSCIASALGETKVGGDDVYMSDTEHSATTYLCIRFLDGSMCAAGKDDTGVDFARAVRTTTALCGDGSIGGAEGCDDGGTAAADGCSSDCTVETGWNCNFEPSICTPVCGDTIILGSEECDDGNSASGDCCSSTCQYESSVSPCADDANVCTDDFCDGAGACQRAANSVSCNDGLFCNGADSCSGGTCSVHGADPCTTGGVCNNQCNEATDNCLSPAGTGCTDDGLPCTSDQCDGAGACMHPPVTAGTPCLDDGNDCTEDECDAMGLCAHPANSDACDDGDPCTLEDACTSGACVGKDVVVKPACEWVIMGGSGTDPRRPKKVGGRLRESVTVTGDVCGDTVRVGGSTVVDGNIVATSSTCTKKMAVQFGPSAQASAAVVTGGALVGGKPTGVELPGYDDGTDVIECEQSHAEPDVTPPTYYDTTGDDPLVTKCSTSRDALATYVEGIEEVLSLGCSAVIKSSLATIAPGGTLHIEPGDIATLESGEIAAGVLNYVCINGSLIGGVDSHVEIDDGGNPATQYILAITGAIDLPLRSDLTLTSTMDASRLLIYGKSKCRFGEQFEGAGTLVCPNSKLQLEENAVWSGSLLSGKGYVQLRDRGQVTHVPLLFTDE